MTKEHTEAALTLIQDLSPQEIAAVLHSAANSSQHKSEHAKAHPLQTVELTAEEVAALCAHLLDGGGVIDPDCEVHGDRSLFGLWMQALHDKDWPAIRHLMPHIIKSWMKVKGHQHVFPGGGRQTKGAPSGVVFMEAEK